MTYWRLVSDHFSSRNGVAMVAKAANKLSRREVARRSQALWDRGFGLGLRLFKVKMGSLGSGVKYFKDLFNIDECGGHVCIVT